MIKLPVSLLALSLLGACSSMPSMPSIPSMPGMPDAPPRSSEAARASELPAGAGAREHVGVAIELMGAGRSEEARSTLLAALTKSPKDAVALRLLEQIDTDPVMLLGAPAGEHEIVAGDTMSVLAERYLGDPLMFYALARYNGLSAPNALSVGKLLKIPARRSTAVAATSAPATPAEAAGPLPRPANAEKASAVRLLALQSLNEGKVARAVTLLKEAQALNGADPAIQKDLDRAMRIQAALDNG